MLGDHPVRLGHGVRSNLEKMGTDYLFSCVSKYFKDSDAVFGNLEVVHSDRGLDTEQLESREFRGSVESITSLKDAGFNVVSFANNHCMEHGIDCFRDTLSVLKENGISAAGIMTDDQSSLPVVITGSGKRIILFAYSMRTENYHREGTVPYALKDEEAIYDQVRSFKISENDVLVVSLHWGEEFMDHPSPRQVRFAHRLVDAGVRIIIGHHPHVLQGIERYKSGVIAYSLGNFVFDMWQRTTRETIIFQADCDGDAVKMKAIPVYINAVFQPEPLQGGAHDRMLGILNRLEQKIKTIYLDRDIDSWTQAEINSIEEQYAISAEKKVLRHRLENYAYFLANLYRYEPRIIVQSMRRFVNRRVEEYTQVTP